MLVDNGKVGPATQLLTMPSSAADEFSGLFRILVEHEMLPQQTAAHPEYVSMLFGSSGCSSGSTVRSYNSFLSLNGSQGTAAAAAAGAAAATKGRASPPPNGGDVSGTAVGASGSSLAERGPAALPGLPSSFIQQQLLLQQGQRQHLQHQKKHKPRRLSAGYMQVSGSPAVVKQWSSSAAAAGLAAGRQYNAAGSDPAGGASGSDTPAGQRQRMRRASEGEAHLHSGSALEVLCVDDSSSKTLTTIEGSYSTASDSRVLHTLSPGAAGLEPQQNPPGLAQVQVQLSSSTCSRFGLPRVGTWEPSAAAGVPSSALLLIGDNDDADELHADQAVAAQGSIANTAGLSQQQQQQQQQHLDGQAEGRKSLSLDRCTVHVHNEFERARQTRTRMSLDEGARTRMSIDESVRAGSSGGKLQLQSTADHRPSIDTAAATGAAAAVSSAANGSGVFFMPTPYSVADGKLLSSDPVAAAAAAATAALLLQKQGPPAAGRGPAAAAVSVAGPGMTATTAAAVASGDGSLHSAAAAVAGNAHGLGGVLMFGGRGLERRTAAEADISAAFTTAWTCHMLELASDLQVSLNTTGS
jgi:hypothetical protein